MNQYLIRLSVDGKRTEVIISASSESNARKIALAQFSGSEAKVINSKKV